jgi:acetyltransferase
VRLGLRDAGEVKAAFQQIMASARAYAPEARLDGVMVQEMVSGGVETIIGITYDEQLGPTLMFGSGGVTVEVYQDVTLRRCPIALGDAHEMIAEVKGSKRLAGFRGAPPADVDALARTLVRISEAAVQLRGRLQELDINPLLVLPQGQGVKAVDALAKFSHC